jgi:hypothetical protein
MICVFFVRVMKAKLRNLVSDGNATQEEIPLARLPGTAVRGVTVPGKRPARGGIGNGRGDSTHGAAANAHDAIARVEHCEMPVLGPAQTLLDQKIKNSKDTSFAYALAASPDTSGEDMWDALLVAGSSSVASGSIIEMELAGVLHRILKVRNINVRVH